MDMRTVVSGIFEHAANVSKNGDLMTPDDNLEPVDDVHKSTDVANRTANLSQGVAIGEGSGSGKMGDYDQQSASNVDVGFNGEDTEDGEGVKVSDEGINGEELIGRADAVEDSEGDDHDEVGEDTDSSFDESDDSNGDTDEEDEDVEYDDEDDDEESVNEVQGAPDTDPQKKVTRLLTETRLTETEVIQNTHDQIGGSQNIADRIRVSQLPEHLDNPDVSNVLHPRLIKKRDSSQSLSDFDPDSYDYQNAVLETEHDLGDSWEWTFPNANISELDIPPELKFRKRSRMLRKFSRYKTSGANQDSCDQSVATQTEGSTPLSEFFSGSDQKERFTVSSRNSAQSHDNNAPGYEMYSRSDRSKKKKKPRRKLTADSLSDVVYFESPTTSRVLKTRLRYLYTDSNVGKTTSCTDGAAGNKHKVLNPLKDAHSKSETANILKEFEQRNVVRTLSKLTNIEARFILTSKPKGVKKPAVGTTEDQDRQLVSSLSLAKSEYQGPLNSSLKLTGSMSERAPSLSDTLTERLIAWRLARGRAMSRPDVFRKSMAVDELEKGVGDFLKAFGTNSRKTEPLDKFRHAVRMTVLMLRAVGFKPEQPDEDKYNFLSWAVVYDEVLGISRLNYDSGSLTFDPLLYKAKKESTISPDVKEILRLPSNQRTDARIHTVRVCFRQVAPSFSEFPIRIQESMIKVCTYEKFEPGRVIIRQGHRAENFYFIISGCAVVTEMDSSGNHVHTTNVLGKGNSFGELAFLNMSQRSATVTCREDVELICIEREDFIDIFMRGVKGKEAEHIAFLRTIDLLKGWPVDSIPHDNPKICAFTYVRRGVILCLDSGKSDWIFVIVSGTCKILKALNDGPVKQPGTHDIKLENPSVVRTISVAPSSSNFSTIYTTNSTGLNNNSNNDINQEMASHGGAQVRVRRQGIVNQPRDIIRTSVNLLKDKREADVSLTRSQHQAEIDDLYFKRHVLPSILDMKPQREAIFEGRSQNGSRKVSIQTLQLPPRAPIFQPKRQSYGLQPPALPQIVSTPMSSRHPIARKVFIEVARLESGDVFGLDQVVLGAMRNVTSCSLVSDGAEVVLINKKFFKKYLTEETLKTMRQKIRPLPSEKSLQNNLDTLKTWEKFKSHTLLEHAQWRQKLAAVPESLK
ncbi:unnamed protein product [Lymnaea stagnalis]|uniref:Cyclic nucleotide-binding domain-containing protein n=1 Tax=Lymnaea stagnalis TaxID=6523 RepID=A0AAV2HC76_LYMST